MYNYDELYEAIKKKASPSATPKEIGEIVGVSSVTVTRILESFNDSNDVWMLQRNRDYHKRNRKKKTDTELLIEKIQAMSPRTPIADIAKSVGMDVTNATKLLNRMAPNCDWLKARFGIETKQNNTQYVIVADKVDTSVPQDSPERVDEPQVNPAAVNKPLPELVVVRIPQTKPIVKDEPLSATAEDIDSVAGSQVHVVEAPNDTISKSLKSEEVTEVTENGKVYAIDSSFISIIDFDKLLKKIFEEGGKVVFSRETLREIDNAQNLANVSDSPADKEKSKCARIFMNMIISSIERFGEVEETFDDFIAFAKRKNATMLSGDAEQVIEARLEGAKAEFVHSKDSIDIIKLERIPTIAKPQNYLLVEDVAVSDNFAQELPKLYSSGAKFIIPKNVVKRIIKRSAKEANYRRILNTIAKYSDSFEITHTKCNDNDAMVRYAKTIPSTIIVGTPREVFSANSSKVSTKYIPHDKIPEYDFVGERVATDKPIRVLIDTCVLLNPNSFEVINKYYNAGAIFVIMDIVVHEANVITDCHKSFSALASHVEACEFVTVPKYGFKINDDHILDYAKHESDMYGSGNVLLLTSDKDMYIKSMLDSDYHVKCKYVPQIDYGEKASAKSIVPNDVSGTSEETSDSGTKKVDENELKKENVYSFFNRAILTQRDTEYGSVRIIRSGFTLKDKEISVMKKDIIIYVKLQKDGKTAIYTKYMVNSLYPFKLESVGSSFSFYLNTESLNINLPKGPEFMVVKEFFDRKKMAST